jgi:hypothetical protein
VVGALNAKALSRVRIPLLRGFFFQFGGAAADWASCVGRLGDVKYLYSEEMIFQFGGAAADWACG